MKFAPVTVSENAGPPAVALEGDIEVTVGAGFAATLIVKVSALDVPPPGAGVCTVTFAVPAVLKSDAGICAVSEVLDTKVVETWLPFHSIAEEEIKPLPDAVKVKAALPALAEFGLTPPRVGKGFCGGGEAS
jgi:hypothetical protein